MRVGGFGAARPLGALMGALHYRFGAADRRQCLGDLAPLLGRKPGDPQVERTLRNAYRVNTIAVLEVLSMVDRQLDAASPRATARSMASRTWRPRAPAVAPSCSPRIRGTACCSRRSWPRRACR